MNRQALIGEIKIYISTIMAKISTEKNGVSFFFNGCGLKNMEGNFIDMKRICDNEVLIKDNYHSLEIVSSFGRCLESELIYYSSGNFDGCESLHDIELMEDLEEIYAGIKNIYAQIFAL